MQRNQTDNENDTQNTPDPSSAGAEGRIGSLIDIYNSFVPMHAEASVGSGGRAAINSGQ